MLSRTDKSRNPYLSIEENINKAHYHETEVINRLVGIHMQTLTNAWGHIVLGAQRRQVAY